MEKLQILIVEDDPIIAADLKDRLQDMGYDIMGAVAAGEEALPFFESHPNPDLLLMDVHLEGEWDGIETARRIREKSDIPIIFLTSHSDDQTFKEAKTVNPEAFLSKPFRGRDLKHAIELAFRQSSNDKNSKQEATEEENTYLLQDRLFIKVKERMQRVFYKDILWVEAEDYYCKVVTAEKELLVTKTLKKFSEALKMQQEFVRVHRSYLVNVNHILEIGELYLYIETNKIPVSKNKRDELLAKLKM